MIDAAVVPDVFRRVLNTKQLLSKGEAKSLTQACKMAGVSRSAFYKYRDSVFLQEQKQNKQTVTFYLRLRDDPGVLASVLMSMSRHDANVMTLNQNIPMDGAADATMTLSLRKNPDAAWSLLEALKQLDGVVEIRIIS